MSTGIYIIKNKINNKVYIGQSLNIERRWKQHLYSGISKTAQDSYSKLHLAMKELGINNFYYEILEETEQELLTSREDYYINFYDSIKNGYNYQSAKETTFKPSSGENNGRALLTEEDVKAIRTMYGEHIRFKEVYELYKGVISKRGLQKVWRLETWKNIMPEVYTEENRLWHKTQACGNEQVKGLNNSQKACSEEEIENIRNLRRQGISYRKIAEQVNRSYSVVYKYCKQVGL